MKIIIAAAAALLAAACSSTSSKSAAQQPPAPSSTSSSSPAAAAPAAVQHNGIGSTVTVKVSGGSVDVTPVKVVDPAPSANDMHVTSGRWVAVQFRFVNKGQAEVSDNLYGLGASDAQGQQIRIQGDAEVAAGPSIEILSGLHLAPGETLLGYIVYKVPDGSKLARIKYTPQGGSMIEWAVT